MAGKSSKGKNRKGSANSINTSESSNASATGNPILSSNATATDNPTSLNSDKVDANGVQPVNEPTNANSETKDETTGNEAKQGELLLYPVSVKTEGGDKLELQLNPADSVMDVRQFLLEAPETCFFTCYDLLLHTKDGLTHQLEDYNEISEVADITTGSCSLEMVAAPYDDRSIRAHVNRTRELLSLSSLHSSLSTSLALEYENAQNKKSGSDATQIEVPELDGLGFMEDVTGSLGQLLPTPSKEIKCVESIVFSSFNPPPSYRRLVGDLMYLDVTTLEGNKFCVTGTTRAFYVNSSTGSVLDPRPKQSTSEATSLIALLRTISSGFKKAFHEILERKASAHSFENVQSLLPPNSWLGFYPIPSHKRDAARAENALTLSYGSEVIGMQTDWNEQLQSCREFPHTTPQERILRDRALYKVTSEFVDAAINGAIGVINRCIPPINPTDPECFHMYVHNNIFFSFAVDADLEQMPKKYTSHPKSKIEKISPSVTSAENVPSQIDGESTTGEANGVLESPNQLSDEAHLAESEQATYASANNDLKGTKAYQEADIPGLYNLAMAIIDYRGHRVVAQSVLPGILHGDKSDSLLYGSVDNGKKICWNEDFHLKVLDAAKHLHLKEHKVLDGSENEFRLAAPVECKGIVGSDDRHYLLDLMRVTPRDANYTGPGSRFCILRPELISAYCQAQAVERSKKQPKSEGEPSSANGSAEGAAVDDLPKSEAGVQSISHDNHERGKDAMTETVQEWVHVSDGTSGSSDEILFNPNVFTEFKLAGRPEEIARDEENVRKVSSYLADTVLLKFIQDLCSIEVSPMDEQTLTEALHAHGINVRYIGKVADGTKHLPHLWDLCSNEIVVRSTKHILKDVLRDTDDHELGPAISHFFNIFFGSCQDAGNVGADSLRSRIQKKDNANHQSSKSHSVQTKLKATSGRKNQSCYRDISSEALWSDIWEFAKLKYQFELPEDARSRVKKVSVLRNLCQKVGITIAARKYDLNASTPFQPSDILDLRPVVKHSVPVCSEAKDLVEAGKAQLAEYMLSEAFNSFSEAFTILQQVTGPMHREVANCCRYLAMVLYHAGDISGAIMQQHKELIINERCLGLDHPDTAHSYGNMALFYHGLNQTELALRHMSRALLLLSLSSGPDHPDVAATFINVAMMYQDIGKMNTALRYLQEALKKNERLLGEEHIQTALCYHALAIAFSCMGAYKLSCQHEKKTHDILVKQLGPKDSRTRDSENWLNTFKKRQEEKGQALNTASAQKAAVDILKAAAAAGGSRSSSAALNAAIIGGNLSRSKRPCVRAARAVEEIRKRAAARALISHQNGVRGQALPELTQVLRSILNSGLTSESQHEGTTAGKNEANYQPSNDPVETKKDHSSGPEQPPAGLGKGLTSLDAKKQKIKSKVAS